MTRGSRPRPGRRGQATSSTYYFLLLFFGKKIKTTQKERRKINVKMVTVIFQKTEPERGRRPSWPPRANGSSSQA